MEYRPPTESLPIFDSTVFRTPDTTLTIGTASKYFLQYPNAQGTENLQTTNVNGALTCAAAAQFNGAVTCASTAQFNGAVTCASTAQLNGALTCASTAQFNGALTCASTAQFNGTLTAANTSTLSTTNINGALTAANTASFTTAIPTCSASYSGVLANDSSTKIPTTAWVQTALATITPVPVTQPTLFTYQYSGTYTPAIPASTVSISVLLIGNGGQRGQTGYGVNTTGLGGTGGAGGYCYFPRLTTTKNITINFTNVGAAQLLISGLGLANNVYGEATAGGNGGNSPLYNSGNGVAGSAGVGYQYLVGPSTLYTGQTGITAQTISFPPGTPDYYQTPAVNPLVATSAYSQYGQGGCSNIIGNYGNDIVVYPSGGFCALWCYPW